MSEPGHLVGTQILLDIPRAFLLTSNQRLHWREKARRAANLRTLAGIRCGHGKAAFIGKVKCTVHVGWPDARRRDAHNLMPTVKPCIDGFVDSGLLEDDSDKYLVGPDLRVSDERCTKGLACSLRFLFEAVA